MPIPVYVVGKKGEVIPIKQSSISVFTWVLVISNIVQAIALVLLALK